jgi:hypothetical protein
MVLLAVALASSSIGIPIAIGAAAYLAWRPSRWGRLWVVAAPLVLYAVWYLGYGKSALKRENVTAMPKYVAEETAGAVSGVAGLTVDWGRALAAAGTGALLWRLSRLRDLPRSFVMVLIAALAFWVFTGLARADVNEPAVSRYVYPGGLFVLLIAVEALRGWRPSRFALAAVGVGTLGAVLSGLGTFHDGANGLRATDRIVKSELAALEIGGGTIPAGFKPDPARAPEVTAGSYLKTVRDIGSSPAYTETELAGLDDGRRRLTDAVFVAGYRLALTTGTVPPTGPAPAVETNVGRTGQAHGSCVSTRPGRLGGTVNVTVTAPPGGISLRAPGARVVLRRFTSGFVMPPLEGDPAQAVLRIPRDRSARPWHVLLQDAKQVIVCGIGTGP